MTLIQILRRTGFFRGHLALWIFVIALGGTSCSKTNPSGAGQDSTYFGRLSFVIKDNATFSNYYSALQMTGMLDTLSVAGPYTVLLADNNSYTGGYLITYGTPAGDLTSFIQSVGRQALSSYVAYAILRGKWNLKALPLGENQELPSIMGGTVYVTRYLSGKDTVTTVNGLKIISYDNPATNGSIDVLTGCLPNPQVYSTVLQKLQTDSNFAFFAAALKRTHLDTLLSGKGPFTVLAPGNSAFRAYAYNGLHLPVNAQSIDSILVADTAKLARIIRYHILPGRYFINDFRRRQTTDSLSLTMLNGEKLTYFTQPGTSLFPRISGVPDFYGNGNLLSTNPYQQATGLAYPSIYDNVRGYNVNEGDLPAANGVIHMLSGVLIP